jgi:hypothetical protein
MPRTSLRIPDEMAESAESIKQQYGMTKAEQFRTAYRSWIRRNDDDIPEWAKLENRHEQITNENNPKMRALNFKQRVYEKLSGFLRDDNGNPARHPPDPDKVESLYMESVRKEVVEEYATFGLKDEYLEHTEAMMEWYKLLHPDTDHGEKREQAVAYLTWVWRWYGRDKAREVAKKLGDRPQGPSKQAWQELIDEARDNVRADNYKDDWDKAVHGEL